MTRSSSVALLFAQPLATLVRDWWSDPDAGHGLLLSTAVQRGLRT